MKELCNYSYGQRHVCVETILVMVPEYLMLYLFLYLYIYIHIYLYLYCILSMLCYYLVTLYSLYFYYVERNRYEIGRGGLRDSYVLFSCSFL